SSVHSAENIKTSELYRMWQTAEPQVKAYLTISFENPGCFIKNLLIGNAGSAFMYPFYFIFPFPSPPSHSHTSFSLNHILLLNFWLDWVSEVMVGKEGWPAENYQGLLTIQSFMNPLESKNNT